MTTRDINMSKIMYLFVFVFSSLYTCIWLGSWICVRIAITAGQCTLWWIFKTHAFNFQSNLYLSFNVVFDLPLGRYWSLNWISKCTSIVFSCLPRRYYWLVNYLFSSKFFLKSQVKSSQVKSRKLIFLTIGLVICVWLGLITSD